MEKEFNSYELSRNFFDWCFENPDKINTNHIAMYFFIIEHCNRLGWKDKFGLPTSMVKDAIGIRNFRTYSKTLNDLVSFGFIKMVETSKNQYSSNIIAIVKNAKAHAKALDKALQKHSQKQGESIASIDKQLNKEQETIKQDVFSFDDFWNIYPNKASRKVAEDKFEKLSNKDKELIKNSIEKFVSYKPFEKYNFPMAATYINQKRWLDEIPQPSTQPQQQAPIEIKICDYIIPNAELFGREREDLLQRCKDGLYPKLKP